MPSPNSSPAPENGMITVSPPVVAEPLPPRTWRQWWRQSPAWVRIVIWGVGANLVICLALFVWLQIGNIEAGELRELRRRSVFFQYAWEKERERFPFEHWLLAGMYGKSCDNVVDLRLAQIGTDADLEWIGRRFRRVKYLNLKGSEISDSGLMALRGCTRLEWLNLEGTAITSAGLECLIDCPKLSYLVLKDTGVDDEGLKLLSKLPNLRGLASLMRRNGAIRFFRS
jgi:hypothetical protein